MALAPRIVRGRIAVCAVLALAGTTAAEPEPDAARLIAGLGDADWANRQKAEDDLVALGSAALPEINAALSRGGDFEMRDRLQNAILRIGRDQHLAATLVTVDETFPSPRAAFAHLAGLLKLELTDATPRGDAGASADRPIALRLQARPWLAAVDEVIALGGFDVRFDDERLTITGKSDRPARPPTYYAGAIAVQALGAKHTQRFDFVNDRPGVQQSMQFAVRCEPKARLRGGGVNQLIVRQCLGDDGKSILNARLRRFPLVPHTMTGFTCNIAPYVETDPPAALKLLEGELALELITETKESRLDDLSVLPQTLEVGGSVVTLRSLERVNRAWKLVVEFKVAPAGIGENGGLRPEEMLRVTDETGNVMRVSTSALTTAGEISQQSYVLTARDPTSDARPRRLAWATINNTRRVTIPFRFTDLPLPK
ncbi:MAG TPA: hypothetical protein VF624_05520 [Tepidisphaeraceae bacterium]|jgi:hypothetical protein